MKIKKKKQKDEHQELGLSTFRNLVDKMHIPLTELAEDSRILGKSTEFRRN